MTLSFQQKISVLGEERNKAALTEIGRGIEREGLRVLAEGKLSEHGHYQALGSALTHPHITTDYAEGLLEFITPVSYSVEQTISQLKDIQKFTLSNIDGELIWPTSMPCFVDDEDNIALAYYGTSNIGKMKSIYRQGLKNRYGSMMQVIAGIHFNFSFPKSFWQTLKSTEDSSLSEQDYISAGYFALLRNYKRYCWLIPYLYGSSPAICPSFLQGKETNLPFKKSESGYIYLEHATSLRMSDLGYTNSEQSALRICYNNIDEYISGVQEAISLSSDKFAEIGVKVGDTYQQLNANVLQIENELYAPVRPKQVANSGEKPSQALSRRGVQYVEVRALDVNPFVDTGISEQQIYFLDVFLTYCALKESPESLCEVQSVCEKNMDDVVVRGRDPKLLLDHNGDKVSVKEWGTAIFEEMKSVAMLLDNANGSDKYQKALAFEFEKINDPDKTPSAKLLRVVNDNKQSLTDFTLQQAVTYRDEALNSDYRFYSEAYFNEQAKKSIDQQKDIEQSDTLPFDDFLTEYFAQ
ncbi:glutamate--cysteine ligase [Thalassotalea sediminis]|uniref:glutamate--cysteine ligase n=1 Tax=Thalassotalea sediminis TaxID=1759089 RepID=UPI002572C03F|nr:glutamate--cysteine ligase [Thalassotalea sediminis]